MAAKVLPRRAKRKLDPAAEGGAAAAIPEPLAAFIDRMPAAVAMFDESMRYVLTSRRFLVDYGLDPDTTRLAGLNHYEVFPEVSPQWREVHRRVLAGETLSEDEEPFPRLDGRTDWVRWEMVPWRKQDGAIGGAMLLTEVITKQKEAELRRAFLLELSDRLASDPGDVSVISAKLLGAHLGVSRVAFGEVDDTGAYLQLHHGYNNNPSPIAGTEFQFKTLLSGITEDLFAGRTVVVTDVDFDARTRDYRDEFGSLHIAAFLTVPLLANGRLVATLSVSNYKPRFWQNNEIELVEEVATRTWSAIDKEKLQHALQDTLEELLDLNRRLAEEVQQRVAAETHLKAQKARLRATYEVVPDGLITMSTQGVIESFSTSASRIFGFDADQLVGRNIKTLLFAEQTKPHSKDRNAAGSDLAYPEFGLGRVALGQRSDGTIFPMDTTISEVATPEDRSYLLVVRDLTETHDNERRLQELQAEVLQAARIGSMGRMATALAHEINQPLGAINSYLSGLANLIANGALGEDMLASLATGVDLAREQSHRAGSIIRNLRNFADRGETYRSCEPIGRVVEEAISLALVGTRELAITLTYHDESEHAKASINRIQIQQVVLCLVRNAIEAVGSTDRKSILVTVTVSADTSTLAVTVIDTGEGLPVTVKERLFQPFVSTKPHGMGLSLAVSREIIDDHRGTLATEPNPDGGTIFQFTLPLAR